ncbi:MAG TPA: 4'-phosphopantetheinyl transferase superfamily protein [Calditrichia bacterium]|nr:4'-phosphopantetheinyl transferase superfamily protein [Calditrichota bacterium]HQV32785.1 4'-phosphopantetheinyl transferase superfamily protein [Calditrichia bacterium]
MPLSGKWRKSPVLPRLEGMAIHLWRLDLGDKGILEKVRACLTLEELERAGRFYQREHREKYELARGTLRLLLGHYTGLNPLDLILEEGPYGKPFLSGSRQESRIFFNISHSGQRALYGFTRAGEIGVDVEQHRPDIPFRQLATRFFAPGEQAELNTLPDRDLEEAFFRCWSSKEAFIKARGEGLSCPLDQFEVSLLPAEPWQLKKIQWDPQEIGRWKLQGLAMGPGYSAALVGPAWGPQPQCFDVTHRILGNQIGKI